MKHIKPFPVAKADYAALDMKITALIRFEKRTPDVLGLGPCWIYLGKWEDGKGFKKVKWKGETIYVHRAMYELREGKIGDGLLLDHKCRVRACCRPDHLEPVTTQVNTSRGKGAWVYGQGAQTGRFAFKIPPGSGQQIPRAVPGIDIPADTMEPHVGPDRTAAFQQRWSDPHFGVAGQQLAPGDVKQIDWPPIEDGLVPIRHPGDVELEEWLPRNVSKLWRWLRGYA